MRITVVGLGKIGLPLAAQYARKGHSVFGADINASTVDLINAATEPFPGEHLLQEYLTEAVASGLLAATTGTTAAVRQSDVIVVAVPLFVDDEGVPDFRALDAAATAIGQGLTPGALVSFETTLPVGTTRTRLTPILEDESGLSAGTDFFVVFSPERVFTGRVFADLKKYPKLVGGIDEASAQRGVDFYEAALDFEERPDLPRPNGVWDVGGAEAAEFAKLAETTYRDVNIGLANQFARYADKIGVDIYKVIEACNSQPFSHIHKPGIAVGGHCIPVYPRLYLWNDPDASLVRVAREANEAMPSYAIDLLRRALGDLSGKSVLVLGVAYRGGVKETAFSGIFPLVSGLKMHGARVLVHDPYYTEAELNALGLEAWPPASRVDGLIVQADHADYASWSVDDVPGVGAVIDGRSILAPSRWPGVWMRRV